LWGVPVTPTRELPLWPDEHFEGFAVVHRLVAVWDCVESDFAVEDLSGFDVPLRMSGSRVSMRRGRVRVRR